MKTCESTENYLKTILILQHQLGQVRSIDVAKALNVSKPSVSNAVKKLRNEQLVEVDACRHLILTAKGYQYASSVFERHLIIERFLTDVLSVDEKTAHNDSCRLEHLVSSETFLQIRKAYEQSKNE